MLFGYPIEATEDNWLHDCLSQIIHVIHDNVANGNTSTEWLSVISEPHKTRLSRILTISTKPNPERLSLGDKLKNYQASLASLSASEQTKILQVFNDQNDIDRLLCGECSCDSIEDLPESIRKPVKAVFESAFKLLTSLEIRDRQYKVIYDSCPHHVCPFCGCEYFVAPGAPREALDHYIPEHKYPFAAANLRNLAPMGSKCNSDHKLKQDPLIKEDGSRRKAFDPYNHNHGTISISLKKSQPFEGVEGDLGEPLPKWIIEFDSTVEEINTWDEVFHIRERYERDVLNEGFNSFIREFGNYCKSWEYKPNSTEDLIGAIDRFIAFQDGNGFKDKSFIKAAVFRMLRLHCQNGDQRLIQFLLDHINGIEI